MSKPGIVFMGTPEFAVASLDAIVTEGYEVKAVVTSPDKPSGRGLQVHASAVKQYALKKGLRILQPLKLKDPEFLHELNEIKPDLQVIVAFRMLPEEVWKLPALGTFNLHASLLPQYRGAAPINWAIINGETKTGVTTFFLNSEIDKGSIIYKEEISIGENDDAGIIHDRLMETGAHLVVKTIHDVYTGKIKAVPQELISEGGSLKPAPKIFKNDCKIQWNNNADIVHNFVRGMSPYPTAWSEIRRANEEALMMKIFSGKPIHENHRHKPGKIISNRKNYIHVAVNDGYYNIERLQLQAKKQMNIEEFLRGFQEIDEYSFI